MKSTFCFVLVISNSELLGLTIFIAYVLCTLTITFYKKMWESVTEMVYLPKTLTVRSKEAVTKVLACGPQATLVIFLL